MEFGNLIARPLGLEIGGVFDTPAEEVKMTLQKNINKNIVNNFIGKSFTGKIVSNNFNYKAQALLVEVPEEILFEGLSFMTISSGGDAEEEDSIKMLTSNIAVSVEEMALPVEFKIEFDAI